VTTPDPAIHLGGSSRPHPHLAGIPALAVAAASQSVAAPSAPPASAAERWGASMDALTLKHGETYVGKLEAYARDVNLVPTGDDNDKTASVHIAVLGRVAIATASAADVKQAAQRVVLAMRAILGRRAPSGSDQGPLPLPLTSLFWNGATYPLLTLALAEAVAVAFGNDPLPPLFSADDVAETMQTARTVEELDAVHLVWETSVIPTERGNAARRAQAAAEAWKAKKHVDDGGLLQPFPFNEPLNSDRPVAVDLAPRLELAANLATSSTHMWAESCALLASFVLSRVFDGGLLNELDVGGPRVLIDTERPVLVHADQLKALRQRLAAFECTNAAVESMLVARIRHFGAHFSIVAFQRGPARWTFDVGAADRFLTAFAADRAASADKPHSVLLAALDSVVQRIVMRLLGEKMDHTESLGHQALLAAIPTAARDACDKLEGQLVQMFFKHGSGMGGVFFGSSGSSMVPHKAAKSARKSAPTEGHEVHPLLSDLQDLHAFRSDDLREMVYTGTDFPYLSLDLAIVVLKMSDMLEEEEENEPDAKRRRTDDEEDEEEDDGRLDVPDDEDMGQWDWSADSPYVCTPRRKWKWW